MEEHDVRERAEAVCSALVSGDVEQVIETFSNELRRNLGEVLAMLPLPSTEATIESIDRGGGSGYTVVLRLVGEKEEVMIQTRWKERDGRPTIIEASHLSKAEISPPTGEIEGEAAGEADEPA
jgi:ABC-type ATPase with predicted acetyltransferase domain